MDFEHELNSSSGLDDCSSTTKKSEHIDGEEAAARTSSQANGERSCICSDVNVDSLADLLALREKIDLRIAALMGGCISNDTLFGVEAVAHIESVSQSPLRPQTVLERTEPLNFGRVTDYEVESKYGKRGVIQYPSADVPGAFYEFIWHSGPCGHAGTIFYRCKWCTTAKKKNKELGSVPALSVQNGYIMTNPKGLKMLIFVNRFLVCRLMV